MKNLFFLIVSISVFSCVEKRTELFDNSDKNKYNLRLEVVGGNRDNRLIISFNYVKPLSDTLIVYKCYNDYTDSCDISKIKMTNVEQDSLYTFFKNAISKFKINEQREDIKTGGTIRLSVFSEVNSMSVMYSGLKNINNVNNEMSQLITFLNRKFPEKFKI